MSENAESGLEYFKPRRMLDVMVALPALVVSGPIIVLAGLAIKLVSPGPAIYRAQRVGLNGKNFTMHKLRTMHVQCGTSGSVITAPDDPRVFALGRFLRATKIDELPQLYDVLRGRMAIVGPRPEAPEIVERHYTQEHRLSLLVRPGMTSPAALRFSQISDKRLSGEDIEAQYASAVLDEKIGAEIDYIKRATVWSDIVVIGQSLVYVLLETLRYFIPHKSASSH